MRSDKSPGRDEFRRRIAGRTKPHVPEREREAGLTALSSAGANSFLDLLGLRAAIECEIRRTERHGHDLTCCLIRTGAEGDAFVEVARTLRYGVRTSDLVGRREDDEFVVVLPETSIAEARPLALRLQRELSRALANSARASIGMANWSPGTGPDELIGRAEDARRLAEESDRGVAALVAADLRKLATADSPRSTRAHNGARDHGLLDRVIEQLRPPRRPDG